MASSRHQSRIDAIQLLYNMEFTHSDLQNAIQSIYEDKESINNDAINYVNAVTDNLGKIDQTIESNLENYTLRRLNSVDRAIIRLATSELIGGEATSVVINEALELTREFSDEGDNKAVRFNNKVLDKIAKSLK